MITIFIIILFIFYKKLKQISAFVSELEKKTYRVEEQMKNRGIRLTDPNRIGDGMRVAIEIKDPISLAKRESFMGKAIGDIAPAIVKKKVYEEIQKGAILELKQQNIEAKVDIINI